MNEPIAAVIIGLLLSLSAGVRITLPLLAVNLLATYQIITLPQDMDWLGSQPTLILLSVAAVAETVIHFIPAAGTTLKAAATPLAFVAGTLLMAVPLGGHNPLYQWTLAAFIGGSMATLMHLGVTGARAMSAPANVASLGLFGIVWNIGGISGFHRAGAAQYALHRGGLDRWSSVPARDCHTGLDHRGQGNLPLDANRTGHLLK